jgi:hypothetical protein
MFIPTTIPKGTTIQGTTLPREIQTDLEDIDMYGLSAKPTTIEGRTKLLLETLRDNILVGDLRLEYINLFFNSVYYVLSEQLYTDWCFKTSFLKINHIIGSLKPRITFKSDEVSSYESFLEEAKPYKTKIREWVSTYQLIENSETSVTDFDLPSYYDNNSNTIERSTILTSNINEYPWKYWLDNNAYKITDIVLVCAFWMKLNARVKSLSA